MYEFFASCMYVYRTHTTHPLELEWQTGYLPYGCWKLNLDPCESNKFQFQPLCLYFF